MLGKEAWEKYSSFCSDRISLCSPGWSGICHGDQPVCLSPQRWRWWCRSLCRAFTFCRLVDNTTVTQFNTELSSARATETEKASWRNPISKFKYSPSKACSCLSLAQPLSMKKGHREKIHFPPYKFKKYTHQSPWQYLSLTPHLSQHCNYFLGACFKRSFSLTLI